jgi:hypothetical protein
MLLDREQKAVFSRWLELQIYTSKGMVEQMQKINIPDALVKRERVQQAACEVVLCMIQSGEEMSIGAPTVSREQT